MKFLIVEPSPLPTLIPLGPKYFITTAHFIVTYLQISLPVFLRRPVLFEVCHGVTVKFARATLEGCLLHYTVNMFQDETLVLWVA